MFMFVVTPVPLAFYSGQESTAKEVLDGSFVNMGLSGLPYATLRARYTPEHSCTALLYQFLLEDGGPPEGRIVAESVKRHLDAMNLFRTTDAVPNGG